MRGEIDLQPEMFSHVDNATHASTMYPDSRLYRKGSGKEAKLNFVGHLQTENRSGFIIGAAVTEAGTSQEWPAAIGLLSQQSMRPHQTVGADKGQESAR